jgi:hypothetical protein
MEKPDSERPTPCRETFPSTSAFRSAFLMLSRRSHLASRIQRQFHEFLVRTGFDKDPKIRSAHTLYSLRHTATDLAVGVQRVVA